MGVMDGGGGTSSRSVVVERRIAAGQGRVWEAMTDLGGMADVISGVTRVEVLTEGGFGVGTRWRETRRMFGKEATEEMWVTACEPPERYVVEAESHGSHYVSEWLLRPDGASATTVRMTFTAVASGGVTRLLARIMGGVGARAVSKAVAKDLDDIAAAVEGRSR
ncbi:SRPBCC family protein [Streptomyces sp. NPDC093591]|uniref:SRPBCC family protein n=1 Tax=Streptomyces sp. NPDC093591 TaxID=3366044 RepID=UPI00382EA314